jgi:hypothetical protein
VGNQSIRWAEDFGPRNRRTNPARGTAANAGRLATTDSTDAQELYHSLLGRPGLVPVPRQIAGVAWRVKGGMARGYSN